MVNLVKKHALRNNQHDCHQWISDCYKVPQVRFRPGIRSGPRWGTYDAPPLPQDPLVDWEGEPHIRSPTSTPSASCVGRRRLVSGVGVFGPHFQKSGYAAQKCVFLCPFSSYVLIHVTKKQLNEARNISYCSCIRPNNRHSHYYHCRRKTLRCRRLCYYT